MYIFIINFDYKSHNKILSSVILSIILQHLFDNTTDNIPVLLWWYPFMPNERTITCGPFACTVTQIRQSHENVAV